MAGFMRHYSGQTYALMRIVVGFLFFWHGSQKILGFPPYPPEVAEQAAQAPAFIIWTSGLIELIGGLFVMVGPLHARVRLPVRRPHGRRLLDGARLQGAAPDPQRRRARRHLLLRLPLHLRARRRDVELRRRMSA
jgi:hypothetical protein